MKKEINVLEQTNLKQLESSSAHNILVIGRMYNYYNADVKYFSVHIGPVIVIKHNPFKRARKQWRSALHKGNYSILEVLLNLLCYH